MKQYILSIFLLSAAVSLNAMDAAGATNSSAAKVWWSSDRKAIVAQHIITNVDAENYTTVTKYIAFSNHFRVVAGSQRKTFNEHAADQETVEMLKLMIAVFEKK